MKIPNDGRIRQFGTSDITGEIRGSFGIDLQTSPGKIVLSNPMKIIEETEDFDNDNVEALEQVDGDLYALTDQRVYRSGNFSSWTLVIADIPNSAQDLVYFAGALRVSGDGDIGEVGIGSGSDRNWWSGLGGPALSTDNTPKIMTVDFGGSEALVVTDGSNVHRYRISGGQFSTVDIHQNHTASCVKSGIRNIWIGSYSEDAGQAYVYQWDGASDNYSQAFPVGAQAVLAMELVNDIPVIVTERGEIKMFNNVGFTTVATLPFAYEPVFEDSITSGLIQDTNIRRSIHPKGMRFYNNKLYLFTNFESATTGDATLNPYSAAGVWEIDLTTGSAHHRLSLSGVHTFTGSSPLLVTNSPNGRFIAAPDNSIFGNSRVWIEDLTASTDTEGWFVTPEITSTALLDNFDGYLKAALRDGNSIVIKYRDTEQPDLPLYVDQDVSWFRDNKFTSSEDLSVVKTLVDAGVGVEVTVLNGSGAGTLSQVVSIEQTATSYTVTVDRPVGTAGEKSAILFEHWNMLETYTAGSHKRIGTSNPSTFLQYKVILRGKGGYPRIREMAASVTKKTK